MDSTIPTLAQDAAKDVEIVQERSSLANEPDSADITTGNSTAARNDSFGNPLQPTARGSADRTANDNGAARVDGSGRPWQATNRRRASSDTDERTQHAYRRLSTQPNDSTALTAAQLEEQDRYRRAINTTLFTGGSAHFASGPLRARSSRQEDETPVSPTGGGGAWRNIPEIPPFRRNGSIVPRTPLAQNRTDTLPGRHLSLAGVIAENNGTTLPTPAFQRTAFNTPQDPPISFTQTHSGSTAAPLPSGRMQRLESLPFGRRPLSWGLPRVNDEQQRQIQEQLESDELPPSPRLGPQIGERRQHPDFGPQQFRMAPPGFGPGYWVQESLLRQPGQFSSGLPREERVLSPDNLEAMRAWEAGNEPTTAHIHEERQQVHGERQPNREQRQQDPAPVNNSPPELLIFALEDDADELAPPVSLDLMGAAHAAPLTDLPFTTAGGSKQYCVTPSRDPRPRVLSEERLRHYNATVALGSASRNTTIGDWRLSASAPQVDGLTGEELPPRRLTRAAIALNRRTDDWLLGTSVPQVDGLTGEEIPQPPAVPQSDAMESTASTEADGNTSLVREVNARLLATDNIEAGLAERFGGVPSSSSSAHSETALRRASQGVSFVIGPKSTTAYCVPHEARWIVGPDSTAAPESTTTGDERYEEQAAKAAAAEEHGRRHRIDRGQSHIPSFSPSLRSSQLQSPPHRPIDGVVDVSRRPAKPAPIVDDGPKTPEPVASEKSSTAPAPSTARRRSFPDNALPSSLIPSITIDLAPDHVEVVSNSGHGRPAARPRAATIPIRPARPARPILTHSPEVSAAKRLYAGTLLASLRAMRPPGDPNRLEATEPRNPDRLSYFPPFVPNDGQSSPERPATPELTPSRQRSFRQRLRGIHMSAVNKFIRTADSPVEVASPLQGLTLPTPSDLSLDEPANVNADDEPSTDEQPAAPQQPTLRSGSIFDSITPASRADRPVSRAQSPRRLGDGMAELGETAEAERAQNVATPASLLSMEDHSSGGVSVPRSGAVDDELQSDSFEDLYGPG